MQNLKHKDNSMKISSIPITIEHFSEHYGRFDICVHYCHISLHCNILVRNEKYLKIAFQQKAS